MMIRLILDEAASDAFEQTADMFARLGAREPDIEIKEVIYDEPRTV